MPNKTIKSQTDFSDKRAEGKRRADQLRERFREEGDEQGWFEAIYQAARGEAELVPWGHLEPRYPLIEWLESEPKDKLSGRALDVGCGLGDNAVKLAEYGFDVTAFDLSATAVKWAANRFSGKNLERFSPEKRTKIEAINWVAADLLTPPEEWLGQFDLVSETFTLQALRGGLRTKALQNLARLPKMGGRLLIICRGAREGDVIDPPPWPVYKTELDELCNLGLKEQQFVESFDDFTPPRRHFLALYTRVA